MKRRGWIALGVLCALLAGTAAVTVAQSASADWNVIGSGGGVRSQGAVRLHSTVGQPVVGTSGVGEYSLCAGFWCQVAAKYDAYIPVILKGYHG